MGGGRRVFPSRKLQSMNGGRKAAEMPIEGPIRKSSQGEQCDLSRRLYESANVPGYRTTKVSAVPQQHRLAGYASSIPNDGP